MPITFTDARRNLRAIGLRIRRFEHDNGTQYLVTFDGKSIEAGSFCTFDLDEAMSTGLKMAAAYRNAK